MPFYPFVMIGLQFSVKDGSLAENGSKRIQIYRQCSSAFCQRLSALKKPVFGKPGISQ
jgi:hypothetical protein